MADGRRTQRSTKLTNKSKAQKLANEWQKAADDAKAGRLVEGQARRVFNAMLEQIGQDLIDQESTEQFLRQWLETKENPRTQARYSHTVESFLNTLGAKRKKPVSAVTYRDVLAYLSAREKAGVSGKTLLCDAKNLNTPFNKARRLGFILSNPVEKALALRPVGGEAQERDIFTADQVAKLLEAASPEWRTVILLGFYTAARIGDCARMRWDNVDFGKGVVVFDQTKTKKGKGSRVVCPLHPQLERHLMELAGTDEPQEFLAPDLAARAIGGKSGLSERFKTIMRRAGIDTQTVQGEGQRRFSKLSFHSLRHSFNSMLANAGIDQETRMALTGHKSSKINDGYTHLDLDRRRAAISKLPDLEAGKEA